MKRLLYGLVDRAVILLSSLTMYRKKYFSKSAESPDFAEQVRYVRVQMPGLEGRGYYEVTGDTMYSTQAATVAVLQWIGPEYPTIIYQYGYMDRYFDFYPVRDNKFKKIFFPDREQPIQANVISIRTMVDGETAKHVQEMGHLSEFIASLCFYTKLNETLIQQLKKHSKAVLILVGTGLGGAVVNLHRAYFNTADAYVPLFSGPALGRMFTESDYRIMTGKLARKNKTELDYRLNFEFDFRKHQTHNVYPMLAMSDRIVLYEPQRMAYGSIPIVTIEKGHYTGINDFASIREHLLSVFDQTVSQQEHQNRLHKRR